MDTNSFKGFQTLGLQGWAPMTLHLCWRFSLEQSWFGWSSLRSGLFGFFFFFFCICGNAQTEYFLNVASTGETLICSVCQFPWFNTTSHDHLRDLSWLSNCRHHSHPRNFTTIPPYTKKILPLYPGLVLSTFFLQASTALVPPQRGLHWH